MKRFILTVLSIFSLSSFLFVGQTSAQTAQSGHIVTIEKEKTVNGDLFTVGQTVAIHGTVNGDLYVGGGSIFVDGTVNGDILAVGGNMLIQGTVHNVRVAGGNVTIDGTIGGNVTAVGGNISIAQGVKIPESLVAAGGQISMLGSTGKGATLASGQTTIGNTIGGDMLAAGNVTLTPGARVNGNLTYWSGQKATIENGAVVTGQIVQHIPAKHSQPHAASAGTIFAGTLLFGLISLISSLIIGILFIQLLPVFSQDTIATIRSHPWLSLGVGVLVAIVVPVALFFIFLTIVGIPIALLLLVVYGVFAYISKIFVALFLGVWVLERTNTSKPYLIWALLLGLIIYEILGIIPLIGWFVGIIFWFIGLGGLLITYKNVYLSLRSKKLI